MAITGGDRKRKGGTLYVSDLDGTLLDERSLVPAGSRDILSRLVRDRGLLFTVATARTQATVVRLMDGIGAPLPYIVMNGAAMWDASSGRYTCVRPIPENTVQQLCEAYERRGVHPFVYRDNRGVIDAFHHSNTTTTERDFIAERTGTPYKRFILCATPYTPNGDPALIIFSTGEYAVLEQIYDDIIRSGIACHAVCYYDIYSTGGGILEVYAPGVSKAAAVTRLKEQASAKRLVVFGDNLNDREMMAIADHSVAVENAVEELKVTASEVIGPNTADSVARWIENDINSNGA